MTHKQQAKDLYNEFYVYSAHQNSVKVRHGQALSFAIKCCNRIILSNPYSNPLNTKPESTMGFWLDVLKELKKM